MDRVGIDIPFLGSCPGPGPGHLFEARIQVPRLRTFTARKATKWDLSSRWDSIGGMMAPSVKVSKISKYGNMAVCQNLVPLVNLKIAGIYGCSSPILNGINRY